MGISQQGSIRRLVQRPLDQTPSAFQRYDGLWPSWSNVVSSSELPEPSGRGVCSARFPIMTAPQFAPYGRCDASSLGSVNVLQRRLTQGVREVVGCSWAGQPWKAELRYKYRSEPLVEQPVGKAGSGDLAGVSEIEARVMLEPILKTLRAQFVCLPHCFCQRLSAFAQVAET